MTVARALLAKPEERHHGYGLVKATTLKSGVVYPILQRLVDAGWLDDSWEDGAEVHGRPPRRNFVLTKEGVAALTELIEADDGPSRRRLASRQLDRLRN